MPAELWAFLGEEGVERAVEAFLGLGAVEGLVAVELIFHGVIKVLADLVDAALCKCRPFLGHWLASEPLRCS